MQIQIPIVSNELDQDEEYILYDKGEKRKRIKLHDYKTIFSIPGLYEKVVYDMLECNSPKIITSLLKQEIDKIDDTNVSDLNVLDLGAGNGIVAEELVSHGVDTVVGVDIIDEAKEAAYRDRPEVYEDYLIVDLANPSQEIERKLENYDINCVTSVAALGFGDIPPLTLANAINFGNETSWIALTIKEEFFSEEDSSGMNDFFTELLQEEVIDIKTRQKYVHRKSLSGCKIDYDALIAVKNKEIPQQILNNL